MKGVPIDKAIGYFGMINHLVGMHELHGLKAGNTGQNGFSPPRVSGIEMGFDQTGQDLQVRIQIVFVDLDRCALYFVYLSVFLLIPGVREPPPGRPLGSGKL